VKKFLLNLLIEKENNISVGSLCMLLLVLSYILVFTCGFFMGKTVLPVTGYEISSIVGVLYGIKKVPKIWENRTNGNGNTKNIGY